MDRYGNLDLDLECEDGGETGGSVSHKAGLFDGMFKKSSKSAKPSTKTQDSLSANGELSNSSDSLTDNNNKEKGGMFKGMFRKMNKPANEDEPQTSVSLQNPELSASNDSLTDKSSKDKSGMFSGILKRSPRPGHVRRPSQDLLEISATDENLSDNNNKEAGGMFSGMFKNAPKPTGMKAASKEDLSADSELAESNKNLSSTKDSGGKFSSMFKKPFGARGQSQEDLTASSELSRSSDNLSEKETGGLFSGMFRKKGARSQSQDDLSVDDEQSAITDNQAEKPSKGGQAAKMLKNPFTTSAQDKTENSGEMNENNSAAQKPKAKTNGLTAVMKSTFYTEKQEKNSKTNDEEKSNEDGDQQPDHKQSKLSGAMMKLNPFQAGNKTGSDDEDQTKSSEKSSTHKQSTMIEAMSKLNPFRSAAKKETEDSEILEKNRKQLETKPNPVKSNMIQPDRRKRSEAMSVTTNSPEEKVKSPREMKGKPSEAPKVPPKPSEEELNRATGHQWTSTKPEDKCGDRGNTENESTVTKNSDENQPESKPTKVKKQKHPNPFMPQAAVKAASDDEGLKNDEESSSREEKKTEDDGKEKAEEPKVKKPKKKNPFMPRVKAKVIQRQVPDGGAGDTAENEPSRSLFDQLEDFRLEPSQPEDSQDVEDLMEWWNTVETWEDTPQIDDMTEKEEAKAFAVTAEKVQKGIRVFNKLFTERAESLWQHVIDLNSIADGLDKFNKNTKIAQITGGSTSAIGGVATIAGLALAPVTMGTSLIVTAVGLGVATAGGLTSAGAGISNQVNNSMDRKKVERIVEDYQEKITDLNKCLKFIKQGIENLRKFDLLKMKKHAYNQDFPALTSQFYEDGAMAGKAILINANEIMRVVQIANVAGSTAARAVQIASMATGVLTGLFVGMDIYFVAKDSKELKKGAKSEFAAKIREVAMQLHEGLVELNSIHEELKSTRSDDDTSNPTRGSHNEKKDKEDKCDSSDEEDEIDRIKKEIKKNIENREYV